MWPDMCRARHTTTEPKEDIVWPAFCSLYPILLRQVHSLSLELTIFWLDWLASKPKRSSLLYMSAPNHVLWFQIYVTKLSFYLGSGDLLLVWQNSLHIESYPQSIYKNLIFTPLRLKPILSLAEASLQHWGDCADTDQERRDL